MNQFYEQFITKDYGLAPKFMQGLFWIFAFFSILFISMFLFTFSLIFIVLTVLLALINRRLFIEYEYEYFQGELTISKIMNKKSRAIIANFNIEQIYKVSMPENIDKSNKIINACIKKIPNNRELVIFVNSANEQVAYYLSIDKKLFNILKFKKPSIFGYI